jgi:D-threo-aldose 1-dehydrogenase
MTTSSKEDFLSSAMARWPSAPIKFGLGGVPFGNEFEVVSDEDAYKTLEAAWNAGVSGSPRYNYGKTSWNIPRQYIEKRERLRAVATQFGADLRTAALQFSAAPDVAAALIVGAHTEAQVLANVSSMQATIPQELWAELKRQNLIEQNAPTPTVA